MSVINANHLMLGDAGYNIQRSLRFRSSASAYLNRTPAIGNQHTWTYSAWVKRGALAGSGAVLLSAHNPSDANYRVWFLFDSDDTLKFYKYVAASYPINLNSTAVYRDPSAWYHIIIAYDDTQATSTNRVKIYVNGSQISLTGTYPQLNETTLINTSVPQNIGRDSYNASRYFDGYLAEVNFIDGQALTPSSFGQTDAVTGVWTPKKYTGTYGTNGFYLPFSDNTSATTLAYDKSGNGNNWTPNNISTTAGSTYDSMLDVPTLTSATAANYCVLNPLKNFGGTISNANLTVAMPASTAAYQTYGTIGVNSGKWYWEVVLQATGAYGALIGIVKTDSTLGTLASSGESWLYYTYNGNKLFFGTSTAYGTALSVNDILGVALDCDTGTLTFYKNGTSFGVAYNTGLTGFNISPVIYHDGASGGGATVSANFGQRQFSYTPPTGFKALNTFNLPDPTIKKPNQYMDATTYTGTGASNVVTNAGSFAPDLLWVKDRSRTANNILVDTVRGANNLIRSESTAAEVAGSFITSLNSNGFTLAANTLSDNYYTNLNGDAFVGWQWKKGATPGFDIVTYTGNGVSGRTVAHSLGVTPAMIITKPRSAVGSWWVYHKSLGTPVLELNSTASSASYASVYNNTLPTSSVFTVGNGDPNGNGVNIVAYLFAEIAGFSKFGSYTGNGSTDGPFVFTNFKPAYVMVKLTSAADNWYVEDSARDAYNPETSYLQPNLSNAEATGGLIDFVSNGFKIRNSNTMGNVSGGTYIYMAFASNPFKYSLGR